MKREELMETEEGRLSALLVFMQKPGRKLPELLDTDECIEIGKLHDQATNGNLTGEWRRLELAEKWVGAAYDQYRERVEYPSHIVGSLRRALDAAEVWQVAAKDGVGVQDAHEGAMLMVRAVISDLQDGICSPSHRGPRYQLLAGCIEFDEGGTTIWVQSPQGETMLRIKCARITVDRACSNTVAHADIMVDGEIEICLPADDEDL